MKAGFGPGEVFGLCVKILLGLTAGAADPGASEKQLKANYLFTGFWNGCEIFLENALSGCAVA